MMVEFDLKVVILMALSCKIVSSNILQLQWANDNDHDDDDEMMMVVKFD